MLVKHGLTDVVPLSDVNKAKAINDLLAAEVLITRTLALDFLKGLNICGLGDLLHKHPCISHYVLPTKEEATVDVAEFKAKVVFRDDTEPTEDEGRAKKWLLEFIEEAALLEGENYFKYVQIRDNHNLEKYKSVFVFAIKIFIVSQDNNEFSLGPTVRRRSTDCVSTDSQPIGLLTVHRQ